MSNSFNRVLSKMPKGKAKKAQLRSAKPMKVNLSQIDEIRDMLDSMSVVSYVLDESPFMEAYDEVQRAQDYLNYEFDTTADDEITALVENLESLGVDIPEEVKELQEQLNYYYEQATELGELLNRLGNNLGGNEKYN